MKRLEIFKAEDFSINFDTISTKFAASIANEILNKFIEEKGVKVYSHKQAKKWEENVPEGYPTHTGILINVQEIKKECRHAPILDFTNYKYDPKESPIITNCKHCDKILKAEWKEVE